MTMKCPRGNRSGVKGAGINTYKQDLNRDGIPDQTKEGVKVVSESGGSHIEFVMQPFINLQDGTTYEMKAAPDTIKPESPSAKVYTFTKPDVTARFFEGEIHGQKRGLMSFGVGQRVGKFQGIDTAIISTMNITGLTIEIDRAMIMLGVARFCPNTDDMSNIKYRAYEQVGDKITQLYDTNELSWVVGGGDSSIPMERFNINKAAFSHLSDDHMTASELLIRPLLKQLGQEAQEVKDGTRQCLTDDAQLEHLEEALTQWYATAKAKDPVRADLIWNDPHLHEGLLRACMIILEINT